MVKVGARNFEMLVGSRVQVARGKAYKTSGGLTASDIMFNPKTGRYVSKRKHLWGKRNGKQQLAQAGYALFTKGGPGVVRTIGTKRRTRRTRRA